MPSYKASMEYVKVRSGSTVVRRSWKREKFLKSFVASINAYNGKYAIRLLNGPFVSQNGYPPLSVCLAAPRLFKSLRPSGKAPAFCAGSGLSDPSLAPLCQQALPDDVGDRAQASLHQRPSAGQPASAEEALVEKRVYYTTRPGSLLKHIIPVRTHNWDISKPGFMEIDLVAHCGNSGKGTFINTLTAVDI